MTVIRRAALICALSAAMFGSAPVAAQQTGPSGLPLPRFATTKFDVVNVRRGPSRDHDVAWVFQKTGIPVEITQEFDVWLHIRDSEGEEGWVQKTQLSGRRGALVAPWARKTTSQMRDKPEADARLVAEIDSGVLVEVPECTGQWCRVVVSGRKGWIDQGRLWGVYPGETFR